MRLFENVIPSLNSEPVLERSEGTSLRRSRRIYNTFIRDLRSFMKFIFERNERLKACPEQSKGMKNLILFGQPLILNFGKMSSFYTKLLEVLKETYETPRADPKQTIIVISVLTLIIAIVVLAAITLYPIIFGQPKKKEIAVAVTAKKKTLTKHQKILFWSVMSAIFIILVFGGFFYAEQPFICSKCHTEAISKTWNKSKHSSVGCISCHRSPGISGFFIQKVDYMRWLWNFKPKDKNLKAQIVNQACDNCHSKETDKVITRLGIKIKHKEVIEIGNLCTDCHNTIGHDVNLSKFPTMDKCIKCHELKKISSKCEYCHMTEVPGSPRRKREVLAVDIPPPQNCRSCHKPKTWSKCIRCHGLEMPHPPGWREGSHARLAFLNKQICFKCHSFPPNNIKPGPHGGNTGSNWFCNNCHSFPSPHGEPVTWAKMHGPIALQKILRPPQKVCSECHGGGASIERCFTCHDTSCAKCHPSSYYEAFVKLQKDPGLIQ